MPNIYGKERPSKKKKKDKKKPSPKMLGTGQAAKAGKALKGRKAQIEAVVSGKKKKKKK